MNLQLVKLDIYAAPFVNLCAHHSSLIVYIDIKSSQSL